MAEHMPHQRARPIWDSDRLASKAIGAQNKAATGEAITQTLSDLSTGLAQRHPEWILEPATNVEHAAIRNILRYAFNSSRQCASIT